MSPGGAEGEAPGRAAGRRRAGWREAALALCAVALALLLLEGGARLLLRPPRYHDQPLEFDPELGFRGVPGPHGGPADPLGTFSYRLNAQGFRGREIPTQPGPAPDGARRVAFVGDSFLVGTVLRDEELVTSRTEAALRSRGRSAEVYNLSVTDYGTAQQLLLLRRFGALLRPEAVVLFLYPANDVVNNARELAGRTFVSAGDYIRPYLEPDGAGGWRVRHAHPARAGLRRHSRLFATLESRALGLGRARGIAWLQPWPPGPDMPARLRAGRAPREDFEVFRRHDPGDPWERAWQRTEALLRAFRDECRALGARLLVVVVPSIFQVERGPKVLALDAATRSRGWRSLDALLDWNLPERRLAPLFASEGIDAHFLLGPLRAAARPGDGVYARDEHLNARGHELAAQAVVAWLEGGSGVAAGAPSGEPVAMLPEASRAGSPLDFAGESHVAHLGEGWLAWLPRGEGEAWGWLAGRRALAALPHRPGDLVVRGWLPPESPLPLEGSVEIVGGPAARYRLESAGPFELRFPLPRRALPSTARVDGYVAVLFATAALPRHRLGAGARVRAFGFEPPTDGPEAP